MSRRIAILTLVAVLLVALGWFVVDQPVALFFRQHTSGGVELFWRRVTDLGKAELYLVPSALLAVFLFWKRRELAWRPGLVFAAGAVSGIIGNLVKWSVGRARPRQWLDDGFYGFHHFSRDWGNNSFPSGHTQATFAAMTALALLYPRWAAVFLSLAVLVAVSRIALSVHYVSDVVGGAWLGSVTALALYGFLKKRELL